MESVDIGAEGITGGIDIIHEGAALKGSALPELAELLNRFDFSAAIGAGLVEEARAVHNGGWRQSRFG